MLKNSPMRNQAIFWKISWNFWLQATGVLGWKCGYVSQKNPGIFPETGKTEPPEFVVRPHKLEPNFGIFCQVWQNSIGGFVSFKFFRVFWENYENDQASGKISGSDFLPNLEFAREKTSAHELRESLTDFFSFRIFGIDSKNTSLSPKN